MSQQSVEVHVMLSILLLGLFVLKFVTIAFLVAIYTNVRAIRMKLRLMGYKLANNEDIAEYNRDV